MVKVADIHHGISLTVEQRYTWKPSQILLLSYFPMLPTLWIAFAKWNNLIAQDKTGINMVFSHASSLKSRSTRVTWIKTETQILHLKSISNYNTFVILRITRRTNLTYRSQFRSGKFWVL